jgi:hypothetical protein
MNSVSEKIKNECLDGMDFERILEIYNLYIDANQPCDFHKLASLPIAASVSWNGKFLTAKLLRETAESVIDTLLNPEFYKHVDDTSNVLEYNVSHGGFTANANAISDDNTVESLSLSWTPFVSESE